MGADCDLDTAADQYANAGADCDRHRDTDADGYMGADRDLDTIADGHADAGADKYA
jgi:hypothetical protein